MTATADQTTDDPDSNRTWLDNLLRWIWVPLAFFVAGGIIKFWVLAPVSWTAALDGLLSALTAEEPNWETAIGGFRSVLDDYGTRFDIAGWMISGLGGLLFGFLALATIFILRFRAQVVKMAALQKQIQVTFKRIDEHLENLESRHNVIQGGTEFGRVLALRSFRNQDLEDGDPWYQQRFQQQPYCVTSTLNLDRAEELLTSEKYMRFFVDKKLPQLGYFRLVLAARQPKNPEGLCAFAAISKALGYQTVFLPRRWWREDLKPALRQCLSQAEFDSLEHLIERNAETAIKGISTDDLATSAIAEYCGRIEKLEKDKTENSTIWLFWNGNHQDVPEISLEGVKAYTRLLGLLKTLRPEPAEFHGEYFDGVFGGTYSRALSDEICTQMCVPR